MRCISLPDRTPPSRLSRCPMRWRRLSPPSSKRRAGTAGPRRLVPSACRDPAAPATGVRVAGRTPYRDPAAPRYLTGSWIRAPSAACRPHVTCGALISSAAASGGRMPERPPYAPIRRVRPLAGPLPPRGAPTARKGPTGALGVALRQTVKGESVADDRESRFEAAGCGGGGAHALSLAFDSAEYALSALRGLSCIASGLAVTELSGHVYSGDAWGLVADITDAAPTRWGASFTAGRGLAHKGISSAEGRAVPWGAVRLSLGVICTRARRSAAMGRGVAVRAGKGARRGVAEG